MASWSGGVVHPVCNLLVAGHLSGVVWELVSFITFVGRVAFTVLVNLHLDSFELVFRISLPWFVGTARSVRRGHSVSFTERGVSGSMDAVMSMGVEDLFDDVMMRMIVKDRSPDEPRDADIVAYA